MSDATRRTDGSPSSDRRGLKCWLTTLLGLVAVCAIGLAAYARHRGSRTHWERTGGMIGWSQGAIESRLGPPAETFDVELPDANGQIGRPAPPGSCRTLIFRTFDGTFVVWLSEGNGGHRCFRSKWAERNTYY